MDIKKQKLEKLYINSKIGQYDLSVDHTKGNEFYYFDFEAFKIHEDIKIKFALCKNDLIELRDVIQELLNYEWWKGKNKAIS